MLSYLPHQYGGQQLLVTNERTLFWENESALILSDVHLGKSGHFRKSGIAVPASAHMNDMHRLISQLQYFKPKRLIIVGDFSHSTTNSQIDQFINWRKEINHTEMHLVKGNHDILLDEWYAKAGFNLYQGAWENGPFLFLHGDQKAASENKFSISGHIHPAVRLKGNGKQSMKLPCFWFTEQSCVLPAFGSFTGTQLVEPKKKDAVFMLTGDEVIRY